MAAPLLQAVRRLPSVCRVPTLCLPACQVRWLSNEKPKRTKKKEDYSWAHQLFEMQQMKQEMKQSGERPQFEPAKLHLVKRIKTLKGRPYWEKDIMEEYKLDGPLHKHVIIRNTKMNNSRLMKVKHLVEIHPVTFPYGLPDDETDYEHCYMRDNGEFVVMKKLKPLYEEYKVVKDVVTDPAVFSNSTIDKALTRRKDNWQLLTEYYPAKYVYYFNQDGKEYRYFGDHNIGAEHEWE